MAEKEGQPEKKKLKLDRSGLNLSLSKPTSLSNGLITETILSPENVEKKKHDAIKSHLKLKPLSKSVKSPVKTSQLSTKRPLPDGSGDGDMPLGEKLKTKLPSSNQSHSHAKTHSTNGESAKSKSDRPTSGLINNVVKEKKSEKHSHKHSHKDSPSHNAVKKVKTEGTTPGSPKAKDDGVKKIKTDSGSLRSPKVEGAKKMKTDSDSLYSPKVEGLKKVKTDSDSSLSSKEDRLKKVKTDSGLQASPKVEAGAKKVKTDSDSPLPSKAEGIKKVKTDTGSPISSKVHGVKKVRTESGVSVTPKVGGAKKIKTVSDSPLSPKVEGVKKVKTGSGTPSKVEGSKKVKTNSSSLSSPKVEGTKKSKTESTSLLSPKVEGVKKVKNDSGSPLSSKVEGVKKIKAESGLPASPKVGEAKKVQSESGLLVSPKVEGVKKIKSESDSSASSKPKSVKDKVKTSTDDSEDDVPLAARAKVRKEDDDDDLPLAARVRVKKESGSSKKLKSKDRKRKTSDDDSDDYKPLAKTKRKSDASEKRIKREKTKDKGKGVKKETGKEKKEAKAKKPEEEVWKWWEEEKHPDGIKWLTLEHKGPYFPPDYEPLPSSVKFYYEDNLFKLSAKSEEVAGFYAKMLDHEYASKKIFNDNFFEDWRKEMTDEERKLIKHLPKCNFKEMHAYYVQKNEERKNMSKEEKLVIKEKNEQILQEYGFCVMDGHKERVGNFKIEPPGLFRGRGDHPKQGKLKRRIGARDITINIAKGATVPQPPEGQRWKAVSHDNKVTWLACWIENIQGSYKYVMLNPMSRIKGEKDWQKYETARKLKGEVARIRRDYTNDWRAKEMRLRQRGVALYFIDKLALRAGHEKDEDTADTVGCCSLRVEHIKLHREKDGKEFVVEFDFLGKDSINYHNLVEVEKRVFKNLELFKQGKTDGDDLFDRLSTTMLNKYLSELMEGLSAKVFRTYNASMTLQDQLDKLVLEDNVAAKVLGYNRANRAVAILCNHQRSAPKTFEQSMSNLQQKIEDKRKAIKEAKKDVKNLKEEYKSSKTANNEKKYDKKKTALARFQEQLFKLEVTQTDKEENKEIALGTSKLNYLDPRISMAWCQKNDVPIEKIYNKTQRQKFAWAIDMTEEDFVF